MGNNIGTYAISKMGIASMAMNTPNINEATLRLTIKRLKELPVNPAFPLTTSRADYDNVIKSITTFEDPDVEIFNALFELFDVKGDESILYRDLIAGIVGCLIVGSLEKKLLLAFELYDVRGKNDLNRADLKKILHSINNTASYFGDNVLEKLAVDELVSDIFYSVSVANVTDEASLVNIDMGQCAEYLSAHESVQAFANSQGTKVFGE